MTVWRLRIPNRRPHRSSKLYSGEASIDVLGRRGGQVRFTAWPTTSLKQTRVASDSMVFHREWLHSGVEFRIQDANSE